MNGRWTCCASRSPRDVSRQAYLLAGPPGVGRRTLAVRFAQALNCTQPLRPGVPCGVCWDCLQIAKSDAPRRDRQPGRGRGRHLEGGAGARSSRAASISGRTARNTEWRIFLRFHEANPAAANALLKILEEPPESVVLILTADDVEAVLPTIVSRCEVLRLRPLPSAAVEAFLKEHGAQQDQARLISHVSGGTPGVGPQHAAVTRARRLHSAMRS